MYKRSDGLSTIADCPNTFTYQSSAMDDAPKDPFHGPVKWIPAYFMDTLRLCLRLQLRLRPHASPPLSQSPQALHRCINSPPIFASGIQCQRHCWHPQFCAGSHFRLDLTHDSLFHQTKLFCFDQTQLWFWFDSTQFPPDLIQLTPNVFIFNRSHTIRITSHSGFRESHIGQGVFKILQH